MKPRSATMPYCRAPPARASAVCVRVGRDRERAVPDATLVRLSLAEAADLIQRRALSPVELLEAVLARIALVDARLNAFTTLVPVEEARAAARAAEREIAAGTYRGPLHGIPAGVKDLLDTAGIRTTYGSGMFRDHVPAVDAAVPARLRAGGAVIVGKTASHEFGKGITTNNYFYGPTRNPWNLDHIPGGSSGGAAAAAAALCGPLQIATDGGGSIRIPAAFCGVVGLKPTLGLLSNRGHTGGGNSSFSVPGPITRSVRDTAIAAEALAGFDAGYIYSRNGPVPNLVAGRRARAAGRSPRRPAHRHRRGELHRALRAVHRGGESGRLPVGRPACGDGGRPADGHPDHRPAGCGRPRAPGGARPGTGGVRAPRADAAARRLGPRAGVTGKARV